MFFEIDIKGIGRIKRVDRTRVNQSTWQWEVTLTDAQGGDITVYRNYPVDSQVTKALKKIIKIGAFVEVSATMKKGEIFAKTFKVAECGYEKPFKFSMRGRIVDVRNDGLFIGSYLYFINDTALVKAYTPMEREEFTIGSTIEAWGVFSKGYMLLDEASVRQSIKKKEVA